jgi:hypothetical protein
MTTIAYDGRYIAVDSRLSSGGHVATDSYEKFNDFEEWILFWSGAVNQKDLLMNIFIAKGEFFDEPKTYLTAYNKKTKFVYHVYVEDKKILMDRLEWIDGQGSGSCYAIGAMDAGKSAVEAVKIAMKRDCATGGKIHCLDTNTGKFIKVKQ